MKKFLLSVIILSSSIIPSAQSLESVKNKLVLQQFQQAREEIDKLTGNSKQKLKAEVFLLKSTVYYNLAMEGNGLQPDQDTLYAEAGIAFKKYRDLEPSLVLLNEPLYQNMPLNVYTALFGIGYRDYQNKSWQAGFQRFRNLVEFSDYLITHKILPGPVDTNCVLLAGITAENANLKDEAVNYYSRIARLKIAGSDMESIYRFLVNYYVARNDAANFEKYRALGRELYPGSAFFNYDRVDFAVGRLIDFNQRIKALDELIRVDPSNYRAQLLLGQLLFDSLHSQKPAAVLPPDAGNWETKMLVAFQKAAAIRPTEELPLVYLGDHFINKSAAANIDREKLDAILKKDPHARMERQQKDLLDQQYNVVLEKTRDYYEKAAAIMVKKDSKESVIHERYKKVASYLRDIYTVKKNSARDRSPQQAQYAAEEKKWIGIADAL